MQLTPEMVEAGAAYLYGNSRQSAIEAEEEGRFQACCVQAETLFNVMLAARPQKLPQPSQQQLAHAEPVGNNPSLW